MTLEDFEKTLGEAHKESGHRDSRHERDGHRSHKDRKHRHHHEREDRHEHRHKRRKHSGDRPSRRTGSAEAELSHLSNSPVETDVRTSEPSAGPAHSNARLQRDSWMEEPSASDFDYTQKGVQKLEQPSSSKSARADFALKIHDNELNKHHLQDLAAGKDLNEASADEPAQHEVNYTFGDAGSSWRMTRLKGVYRRAEEQGRHVEDVAEEQYGNLRAFDDAREEQTERERRETYGKGYVGKEKPSGDLFAERKLDMGIRRSDTHREQEADAANPIRVVETMDPPETAVPLDQSVLNRLKAQMMKAKLRGGPEYSRLESEYNTAQAQFANQKEPGIVVLGTMENRMLARGRNGEVKAIDNKRGRERGLVEENEDMTIEDMVREERRTRGQAGGDGRRFAERIAKDGKFDNDLDYMDENATKLARRVQRSEINLKSTAISDFQKMNRILDSCPLCHHEDTNTPPVAPVVSLGTRVYLTLPTEPEISEGGACIIPIQHRDNLLECDDDEWEEVRNFMKSLTRMYHDQGRDVIFYESAAAPQRKKHAGMQVVPLPYSLGETAPAFFKEAIMTADEEWTQHKKVIDTLSKAKNGLGKLAFRRTLVKEMPYFHVWLEIDGGLGHVVEDLNRWPKGDLFAREIIGGMLDKGPDLIKRQGKWRKGGDSRVDGFRRRWRKFDWTRVLTDG